MKCVRLKNGKVYRVSNLMAFAAVSTGMAQYCTKKEWKDQGRKYTKFIKGGIDDTDK